MIITHSGESIDSMENPLEAVELALVAAAGASAKARAWNWAEDAFKIVQETWPHLADKFSRLLGVGLYPNTSFNLSFLESSDNVLYNRWIKNPDSVKLTKFQKALFIAFKLGEKTEKGKLYNAFPDIFPTK